MRIAIGILAAIFGIISFLAPLSYGLLFLISLDSSSFVSLTIAAAVLVSVISVFVNIPSSLSIISITAFSGASLIGLFVHFRDSGESGPLPYEWLNEYYEVGIPTLFLVILSLAMKNRQTKKEAEQD